MLIYRLVVLHEMTHFVEIVEEAFVRAITGCILGYDLANDLESDNEFYEGFWLVMPGGTEEFKRDACAYFSNGRYLVDLGSFYLRQQREDEKAEEAFKEAMARGHIAPSILFGRAAALENLGRTEEVRDLSRKYASLLRGFEHCMRPLAERDGYDALCYFDGARLK